MTWVAILLALFGALSLLFFVLAVADFMSLTDAPTGRPDDDDEDFF